MSVPLTLSGLIEVGYGLPMRQRVQIIEDMIKAHPEATGPDPFPLFHRFLPGLYLRTVYVPAGQITVSKIHKRSCTNVLIRGDRTTLIDGVMVRVKAPHTHISPAGFKRISYTHADAVWMTIHETQETEIDKLEHDLVCETEQEYRDFCRTIAAEGHPCLS